MKKYNKSETPNSFIESGVFLLENKKRPAPASLNCGFYPKRASVAAEVPRCMRSHDIPHPSESTSGSLVPA